MGVKGVTSNSGPHYIEKLAEFVFRTELRDIPQRTVARTRSIIADCLPVIASGMQTPEMKSLVARHLADDARGCAWVIGARRRAPSLDAALLNGTAGTWLELDEGNTYAKGHPGIQVVPAALAVAQEHGLSGEALLTAVALGYEVSSRISRSAHFRDLVHPHGTVGVIGAAAAVGRLRGLDQPKLVSLFNIAASMAMATSYRTLYEGATVRNIYTGHSGYMGQIAVQLALSGFTGEPDGVATTFGELLSSTFDRDLTVSDLGRHWLIDDGYFKLHPTARSIQTAIDALEELMKGLPAAGIDPARIRAIEVSTYRRAAEKIQKKVTSSFGAKFSIPFAVATILHHGRSGLESFGDAAVANPLIQQLASIVEVKENPLYTRAYPREQRCDITVTLADGITYTGRCVMTKGEPGNPIRDEELKSKFFELGVPLWGDALTTQVYEEFMHLENVNDLKASAGKWLL
jgi:2-methylcitrate dehydratase PrpD